MARQSTMSYYMKVNGPDAVIWVSIKWGVSC